MSSGFSNITSATYSFGVPPAAQQRAGNSVDPVIDAATKASKKTRLPQAKPIDGPLNLGPNNPDEPPAAVNIDALIDEWGRMDKDDLVREVKREYGVRHVDFSHTTAVDMRPVNGGLRSALAIRLELFTNPQLLKLRDCFLLWDFDYVEIDCRLAENKWESVWARSRNVPTGRWEAGLVCARKVKSPLANADERALMMVMQHEFLYRFTGVQRQRYTSLCDTDGLPILRVWLTDCLGIYLPEMRAGTFPATSAETARAEFAEELLAEHRMHPNQ
jgi:hypothetical protein